MNKEIEDRLLSTIKNSDDLSHLILQGIDSESFVTRREVFDFYKQYNSRYGSIPSQEVVESSFVDFKIKNDINKNERKYLIDEVRKNDVRIKAIQTINKGSDLLLNDPNGAVDYIVSQLTSIRSPAQFSRSLTDKDALQRVEALLEQRSKINEGKISGIRTGLSIFDDKLMGWAPGNLIGIVGRLGIGKSWLLEYMGISAYLDNHRVVYLSPEMSIKEVEGRWDTIVSTMVGDTLSNEAITSGTIDENKYRAHLERVASRGDWLTMDSNRGQSFTVSSIRAIVDEFQPDVVCVDGFLLLDPEARSSQWDSLVRLAYGLKAIAQNQKIVMIVTTQANRDAASAMPELHQVYGGDALMQAVDVGITMAKDDDQPFSRFIMLPKVRGHKSFTKKIKINFDVDNGKIGV